MLPQRVPANGRIYTVVDDCTTRYAALAAGRVCSATTGQTLPIFTVVVDHPQIRVITSTSGLFALAGIRERIFPDAGAIYSVALRVHAQGYRSYEGVLTANPNATLPIDLGDIQLTPQPKVLRGRVTQGNGSFAPIGGARIIAVDNPAPPAPLAEHPLALRTPLAMAHERGVTVRECQFTPDGVNRRLVFDAPAGSTVLALDATTGLAAGHVLALGTGGVHAVIAAPGPRPYEVTLRQPLPLALPSWTPILRVNVAIPPAAATGQLVQPATAGDGVLLLDGVLDVGAVEIDAGLAVEYRAAGALTGPDGYYQLQGMTHAAAFYLEARAAGFNPLANPVYWVVSSGEAADTVDFTLVP